MSTSARRSVGLPTRPGPARSATTSDSLPLVEIVLSGVDADEWVTDTLSVHGVPFRLLTCRSVDRGRRRLLRLFEVQAGPDTLAPVLRRLRARLSARDVAVTTLGPERALLRVSVPMPSGCGAAFDLGDFCIDCPYRGRSDNAGPPVWKVLVPQILDARRLLSSSQRPGGARPTLVRAGAYRRRGGLTGRQERAIRVALQLGYFDYPRRAKLSAVADRLGVGRSTALELLRKATTKIAVDRFLTEPPIGRAP